MSKIFKVSVLIFVFFSTTIFSNPNNQIENILKKIRSNENLLIAFFSAMPKGGDLHHHYSGSVYAETYLEYVIQKDFYLDTKTLLISETPNENIGISQFRFSELKKQNLLNDFKYQLLKKWSIKDYHESHYPSYKQFFETFMYFDLASKNTFEQGLLELKERAIKEKVSYIETMLTSIPSTLDLSELKFYEDSLWNSQFLKDSFRTQRYFDFLFKHIQSKNAKQFALDFNVNKLEKLHHQLKIDDENFLMRYQNYVLRFKNPLTIFKDLVVAFESAQASPFIVGVNIVAPEHEEVSMHDYWLHMQMYKFFKTKYPSVKFSVHAGELTLGLVKPEELTWHISEAVYVAGANRIGHGVDLPYEQNCFELLNYMKEKNVAVEINLFSNEFILNVKDNQHPLMMYHNAQVPIVISSDDAGVLRDNLTHQFVLLAKRYPEINYAHIKQFVLNSIEYSFIKEKYLKEKLIQKIKNDFLLFEQKMLLQKF